MFAALPGGKKSDSLATNSNRNGNNLNCKVALLYSDGESGILTVSRGDPAQASSFRNSLTGSLAHTTYCQNNSISTYRSWMMPFCRMTARLPYLRRKTERAVTLSPDSVCLYR